jgi:hypothetical protein
MSLSFRFFGQAIHHALVYTYKQLILHIADATNAVLCNACPDL